MFLRKRWKFFWTSPLKKAFKFYLKTSSNDGKIPTYHNERDVNIAQESQEKYELSASTYAMLYVSLITLHHAI